MLRYCLYCGCDEDAPFYFPPPSPTAPSPNPVPTVQTTSPALSSTVSSSGTTRQFDPMSTAEKGRERPGLAAPVAVDQVRHLPALPCPCQADSRRRESVEACEARLLRKQDVRIIPLSAAIYFLCFLDRANMGNARILNSTSHHDMQRSLAMTDHQFVVALMVFLVAYAVFEVPSNVLLKKLRPSRWLAFLMFGWGAVTVALGATRGFAAVAAVRFLLGVFEAGLFPGLVYYLTFWYRRDERSVR